LEATWGEAMSTRPFSHQFFRSVHGLTKRAGSSSWRCNVNAGATSGFVSDFFNGNCEHDFSHRSEADGRGTAGPTSRSPAGASHCGEEGFHFERGEDTWLDFDQKHDPTLTYNEFYADVKSGGKYELVSSPADSDVVFEIHLALEATAPILRLRILDPKSRIVLWPIDQRAKVATRDATARKNFDEAMNTLMGSLKKLVTNSP